jgi:hypothetical protein
MLLCGINYLRLKIIIFEHVGHVNLLFLHPHQASKLHIRLLLGGYHAVDHRLLVYLLPLLAFSISLDLTMAFFLIVHHGLLLNLRCRLCDERVLVHSFLLIHCFWL